MLLSSRSKKEISPGHIFDSKRGSFFWKEIDEASLHDIKKSGDRVAFVSTRFSPQRNNPVIGSEYQCLGVVTGSSSGGCSVTWDNDHHNSYSHDDLMLTNNKNPNYLFRRHKNKQSGGIKW